MAIDGVQRRVRWVGRPALAATVFAAVCSIWATPPASAWSGEVAGRRVEVAGHLEIRQVFRVDRDTPHELNQQRLLVETRSWWTEDLQLEVDLSIQNGGPATRASSAGFYNVDDVFQSLSPAFEIEEAFVRYDHEDFTLRLGQIKHAWGKLDRYQPNDTINPERFADPLILDEAERKIGVPSMALEYHLPPGRWWAEEASLQLIWVPRAIPFRLGLSGERWFPPNAVPPETFRVDTEAGPIDVPLALETDNRSPPAFTAENATYAARFAAHTGGVDYAVYYRYGVQSAPTFRLDARADVTGNPADPLLGTTILAPVFPKIHVWGGDFAVVLGDFGIRAEIAYSHGRGFNRDLLTLVDDPAVAEAVREAFEEIAGGATSVDIPLADTFAISDAVQWGIGVDTRLLDFDLLFEVSQTNVLEGTVPLLIEDSETVLLADVRRSFLRDDLDLQLVAVYGASSDYTVLMPRLTYRIFERFEARIGYLHVAGRARTTLGQYKRNDEGFIRLRYYL